MSPPAVDLFDVSALTPQEEAGQRAVAVLLGRSARVVRWRTDVPNIGWGLVVHTPWARVLIARTGLESCRWPQDCQGGTRAGTALLEALCAQYPQVCTAWASASELVEQPLPVMRLRRFVVWALGRNARSTAWMVGPGVRVMGSWASWPDAVLVEMAEPQQEPVYQLRAAPWAEV